MLLVPLSLCHACICSFASYIKVQLCPSVINTAHLQFNEIFLKRLRVYTEYRKVYMVKLNRLLHLQILLIIFILSVLTDGVMFDHLSKLKTFKSGIFMIGNWWDIYNPC